MTPNFKHQFQLQFRGFFKIPYFIFRVLLVAAFFVPASAQSEAFQFIFASDLPAAQKQTVLSDLSALNQLHFSDVGGKGAQLFGRPLNAENLKKWLADRGRYIVAESFNYHTSIKVVSPGIAYPNAELLPYREVAPKPRTQDEAGKVVTVMTNTGAQVYIHGKRSKNLLSVDIAGIGPVTISSPRIGLFKIGAGLFSPLLQTESSYVSFANSLRRLAVYFHEARHSDGNGKSLGFLHAPCPPEKGIYAGSYACDRNQNGPYSIEGTFIRSAVDKCKSCTRKEKEALRNVYADKFNRLVRAGTHAGRTEQRVPMDSAAETCNQLKVLNVSASSAAACNSSGQSQAAAPVTAPEPRPAWLDERPEGVTP